MTLGAYRPLGRSGLLVSPFALGTMTFGTQRWGTGEDTSRDIFLAYCEQGGNFIDTADVYASGRSEEMLGRFVLEHKLRDQLVIATKAGFSAGKGPLLGGNGAKHLRAALDASLKRLQTDYVDMYWVHVWDGLTPAEELLATITALVSAGKVRYWGISNAPAWYVSKIATLAQFSRESTPIGLQYFYSLANRDIEEEIVPLAAEFGMGIVPWSPLAYGLLTGKYTRESVKPGSPAGGLPTNVAGQDDKERSAEDRRLDGSNPFGDSLFTERNWNILDELREVAKEAQESPARVALAWVSSRRRVVSTLMGVSRTEQVPENIAALAVRLTAEQIARLDAASAMEPRFLYTMMTPQLRQGAIFGGALVQNR